MQLRTANSDDAQSVLTIIKSSRAAYLPYAISPHTLEQDQNWVIKTLIPTGNVLIGSLGGNDVGVLATSIEDGVAWIDQLYIAPGQISKGNGTQLLIHALNSLPRPIRLWTFQQNHRARGFYEHHGFKAIKQTNGEDNEEKCPDVLYQLDHISDP